jgi:hypothetical protein
LSFQALPAPHKRPLTGKAAPPLTVCNRKQVFRVGQQVPSKWAKPMPRYFFDTMDSGRLICDESGVELPSIQAARAEAARSLADIARDMSPDDHREVVVEVSDGEGCPLFRAALYFEIEDLVPSTL